MEGALVLPVELLQRVGLHRTLVLGVVHLLAQGEGGITKEGKRWVRLSHEDLLNQPGLDEWSLATLKRALSSLRKEGYLCTTSEYNSDARDRTLWFALAHSELMHKLIEPMQIALAHREPLQTSDVDFYVSGGREKPSQTADSSPSLPPDPPLSVTPSSSTDISLSTTEKAVKNQDLKNQNQTPTAREAKLAERFASGQQNKLRRLLNSGKAFDLKREFRPIFTEAWKEAVRGGVDPRQVGCSLLLVYYTTITSQEAEPHLMLRLVSRWGLLAVEGVDSALNRRKVEDWFTYAWKVCEYKSQERERSE